MKTSNTFQNTYNIKYSQNFIHSEPLSKKIISLCDIAPNDLVIEIGPGRGALTQYLVSIGAKIIAIEKDPELFLYLKDKHKDSPYLSLTNEDFLTYQISSREPLVIVGNIPFGLTTSILKKVLDPALNIKKVVFVMQTEAALRLIGSDTHGNKESLFSLRYKPYFTTRILYRFLKSDFHPKPNVDTVLLDITRKSSPDMQVEEYKKYLDFISYCFSAWKPTMKNILRPLLSNLQRKIIQDKNHINLLKKPTELSYPEWLSLFQLFLEHVPVHKQKLIVNATKRMLEQENRLIKKNRTR